MATRDWRLEARIEARSDYARGADGKGAHAACEQIYYSSLIPRTHLCTRLLETLD
jgi:hypothetical protein